MNGVYCLTSPKGKRYVGVGVNKNGNGIEDRWCGYKHLHKKVKEQPRLYNSLKKYGPSNFKFEVILETNDRERALTVEKQLIALWGLQNDKNGFNITPGGDGNVWSDETREKMRIAKDIFWKSPRGLEMREWISKRTKGNKYWLGKKHKEETKHKMSKSMTGLKWKNPMSMEQRKQISERLKGNTFNRGRKISEETRSKFKIVHSGERNGRAVIRRIQNIKTNEILEGCLTQLARDLGLNPDSLRTSIVKRKRYLDWILLDGN